MIWAQLCRFGGNKSGVIAVVIALAFVPMVLATGVAVDFTRAFIVQQKMFTPPATDDQTRMQQKMMKLMPLMFGFFFFIPKQIMPKLFIFL